MKILLTALLLSLAVSAPAQNCPDWMQQDMQKLRAEESVNICELAAGKVVLMVNTASKCGFTGQFKGLQTLHEKYQEQGLVVIGFPSNSFLQEHTDEEDVAEVCYVNFGVTFTMLETSPVKGRNANALFSYLNDELGSPAWNFNKYLIDREGNPVQRFGSRTAPDDKELTEAIESLL